MGGYGGGGGVERIGEDSETMVDCGCDAPAPTAEAECANSPPLPLPVQVLGTLAATDYHSKARQAPVSLLTGKQTSNRAFWGEMRPPREINHFRAGGGGGKGGGTPHPTARSTD